MTNIDEGTILFYLRAKVVSDKVKAALAEIIKRKNELDQLVSQRQRLQERVREIDSDQNRIRQNMDRLDRGSDLYKNYVKKFSDQETEIEKLRGQIADLVKQEADSRKSLDEYMMGLDLE